MLLLYAAISAGVLILTHTAPFPFVLEGIKRGDSMWHAPADPLAPVVYLTFDDGPNPNATPAILDVLKAEGASATFFLIDDHLTDSTAPIVRRMFDEGHAVALHSNERWLMLASADGIAARLQEAVTRIEQLAGARPCPLFRPHAGWRSAPMYAALERMGYTLTGWSWALWDWNWWKRRDGGGVAARLGRRANAGDIIVIHDGHHVDPTPDRRYAVEATAQLIPALRARGLSVAKLPCSIPTT
jgi:peptidoglycan/xylan/chitin deacetylase (PgdA/CDA1 family)